MVAGISLQGEGKMRDIYLIEYAVRGIKSLDEWVELSFYKKTFTRPFNIKRYNVKGIYGLNGTGKSAIITSVDLLKGIVLDSSYLYNPINQKNLTELVNKKLGKLDYRLKFLVIINNKLILYNYELTIWKDHTDKYAIKRELLSYRYATSKNDVFTVLFETENDNIINYINNDDYLSFLMEQTKNLLTHASLSRLALEKTSQKLKKGSEHSPLQMGLVFHFLFISSLYVYMENADDHTEFLLFDLLHKQDDTSDTDTIERILDHLPVKSDVQLYRLSPGKMIIPKNQYDILKKQVCKLKNFLKIFKSDIVDIQIDRRDYKDCYQCELILEYDEYSVNAEFESTGIKKLISIFAYLQKVVQGDIVFIDEMDSNLHDVYLCALLEYLMEYGNGQLCFTTHNIGPMDILKRNKKSIEFLSVDHHIHSWTTNGNYSPSKLYKNGMIDGSPFNISAIDFLSIFESEEDE